MFRNAQLNDKSNILEYIGNDYNKCLYLYLDFIKYGFDNKNVSLWIDENSTEIRCLILLYYSGMHIFSKNNNFDVNSIISFISDKSPSMICGEKNIISCIENNMKKQNYLSEYGWVRVLNSSISGIVNDDVIKASKDDFDDIADLLYADEDIGSSYKYDELLNQIIIRNNEKYGRNYIIKNGKKVISHAGTGAENEKVAMLNYVITTPEYRGLGLAKKVTSKVCNDLIKEGKKVYLINYSNESTSLYDKLGFKVSCEWGKLFKDLKKEGN